MPITLELPDEVLARLRAEASRRGLSLDDVVAQLVAGLPADSIGQRERHLGFVGLGASRDGRSAVDADEMLAEGFGRD